MRLALSRHSLLDRWIVSVTLLFLFAEVAGGVLRYTLAGVGLSALVYLPKLLLALTLFVLTLLGMARGRLSGLYLSVFAVCTTFAAVGFFLHQQPPAGRLRPLDTATPHFRRGRLSDVSS